MLITLYYLIATPAATPKHLSISTLSSPSTAFSQQTGIKVCCHQINQTSADSGSLTSHWPLRLYLLPSHGSYTQVLTAHTFMHVFFSGDIFLLCLKIHKFPEFMTVTWLVDKNQLNDINLWPFVLVWNNSVLLTRTWMPLTAYVNLPSPTQAPCTHLLINIYNSPTLDSGCEPSL